MFARINKCRTREEEVACRKGRKAEVLSAIEEESRDTKKRERGSARDNMMKSALASENEMNEKIREEEEGVEVIEKRYGSGLAKLVASSDRVVL
jgi:hypothetical protein